MSLFSDRRTSFFLAALTATTALSACTGGVGDDASLSTAEAAGRSGDDSSTRTVRGKVTSEDGVAIAGAALTAEGLGRAVITDGNGDFVFETLPVGDVTFQVGAGSYETIFVPVRPGTVQLDPKLTRAAIPWPPLPSVKKGLTWVKALHDNARGQDQVSCHDYTIVGGPGPSPTPTRSCDPYVGDTACNLARPILCLKQDGSGSNGHVWNFYNGWAKGNIGITHPIIGQTLTSLAVADAQCVAEFGAGWRMASHHDGDFGGGWQWRAYGNLNTLYAVQQPGHTLDHRFWVYILEGNVPNPWDPTNPNNPPNQLQGRGITTLANVGNCWN